MKFIQNKIRKNQKFLKCNLFPKNRRGDIAILLLVILVLLVASATLFSFVISSGKVEAKISSAQFIKDFYSRQNLIEFYLNQAGENSIRKTYNEFVENGDYINNLIISGGEFEFEEIHNKLSENFRDRFIENFKEEFKNYNFEEAYLKNLKQIILEKNFDVVADKNIVMMKINNLEMNDSIEGVNINYIPKISLELNLKKIGLHSFEDIYEIKERCKDVEMVKECYEDLINFNVNVEEKEKSNGEKYFLVTLTSKKQFLIDEKFENIDFSFVPM